MADLFSGSWNIRTMLSVRGPTCPGSVTNPPCERTTTRATSLLEFTEATTGRAADSNVTLTVVHPGGVRTAIATNARLSQGIDPEEARIATAEFNKLLRTSPEDAAEQIARAIETRAPRLLIGSDARMLDRLQRIFPSTYWKRIAKRVGAGKNAAKGNVAAAMASTR